MFGLIQILLTGCAQDRRRRWLTRKKQEKKIRLWIETIWFLVLWWMNISYIGEFQYPKINRIRQKNCCKSPWFAMTLNWITIIRFLDVWDFILVACFEHLIQLISNESEWLKWKREKECQRVSGIHRWFFIRLTHSQTQKGSIFWERLFMTYTFQYQAYSNTYCQWVCKREICMHPTQCYEWIAEWISCILSNNCLAW